MSKSLVAMGAIFLAALIGIAGSCPVTGEASDSSAAKKYSGDVLNVDTASNQLTVKSETGEVTMSVDTNTKITKGGKEITLAEIKVGDSVACDVEESPDGRKAKSVEVKAKPPMK
jgi:hypothetical protein